LILTMSSRQLKPKISKEIDMISQLNGNRA
jgi:hypothetical protein